MSADLSVVGELGVVALDHTAIAVRSIAAALPLYRDLLGGVPSWLRAHRRSGVHVADAALPERFAG